MHRPTLILSISRFLSNESGSPAVEYALVAAGISIAVVGVVTNIGTQVKTTLYDRLVALF